MACDSLSWPKDFLTRMNAHQGIKGKEGKCSINEKHQDFTHLWATNKSRTSGQLCLISGWNIYPKRCILIDTPVYKTLPLQQGCCASCSVRWQSLTFIQSSALSKPTSMLMMSNPEVDLFFWWTPRINAHKVCKGKIQRIKCKATPTNPQQNLP